MLEYVIFMSQGFFQLLGALFAHLIFVEGDNMGRVGAVPPSQDVAGSGEYEGQQQAQQYHPPAGYQGGGSPGRQEPSDVG